MNLYTAAVEKPYMSDYSKRARWKKFRNMAKFSWDPADFHAYKHCLGTFFFGWTQLRVGVIIINHYILFYGLLELENILVNWPKRLNRHSTLILLISRVLLCGEYEFWFIYSISLSTTTTPPAIMIWWMVRDSWKRRLNIIGYAGWLFYVVKVTEL